ncbi:Ig-like domain-containing protein [Chakrabartyella piscis]|uniref:Ig-like domain-containing protein n=1 Tax=Chakrabartyella piscis TaxID=2918914 RepID=UPI00295881CB|nr:S-layer homology domain-containing protein [Chakrabartyella piscis]
MKNFLTALCFTLVFSCTIFSTAFAADISKDTTLTYAPEAYETAYRSFTTENLTNIDVAIPEDATEIAVDAIDYITTSFTMEWDELITPIKDGFCESGFTETVLTDANNENEYHYEKDGLNFIILSKTASQKVIFESGIVYVVRYYIEPTDIDIQVNETPETASTEKVYFEKKNEYIEGQFTDVPSTAWYANSVENVYELGLMSGSSENTFNPTGNVTVAETIVLASRLHQVYNTINYDFSSTTTWYQPYIDYATEYSIINSNQFSDYKAAISRGDFALVLVSALPEEALVAINKIEDKSIPDVETSSNYYNAVYTLYRAGILSGNDSSGAYTPDTSIQRSATASIITRIADESLRTSNTLEYVVLPTGISLDKSNTTLSTNQSVNVSVIFSQDNITDSSVTWTSSNSAVATVNQYGVVSGVSNGEAIITATTSNGLSASCVITAEAPDYSGWCVNALSYLYKSAKLPSSIVVNSMYAGTYERSDYNTYESGEYIAVVINISGANSFGGTVSQDFIAIFNENAGTAIYDLYGTGEFNSEYYYGSKSLEGIEMKIEALYLLQDKYKLFANYKNDTIIAVAKATVGL